MSKIVSLLKATMSEGMNIFSYGQKQKTSQRILPIALGALVFLVLFSSASSVMTELKGDGKEYIILALFVFITTILAVTEGIYKSGSLLFSCRDNDMLLAMPIKKSTITFIRIFKFYAFQLIYSLIFLGPAILAYILYGNINASFFLVAIIMLLFIPVIPVAVSCLIGAFTSAVSSRTKHKSAVQVILSIFFFILTFALVFAINSMSDNIGAIAGEVGNNIIRYYYPAEAFVNLAMSFSVIELLKFIAINLAIFAVVVLIIGKFYFPIVNRVNIVKRDTKTVGKLRFAHLSQTKAIVRKEIIKYFSTPVLLTNTAVGLILFVIGVGALCIKFDDLLSSINSEDIPFTADQIRSFIPGITFALVAFTSLMTFITTTSISLEGKAFNILKTMPISGKKVIYSKILAAMILITPLIAIGSIVMFIKFQFSIIDLLLILAATVIMPLVTETIGIMIDLKYARFNYVSDAEIVKQSQGIMVSSFLGLAMTIVTISLTFVLVFLLGQTAGLVLIDIIFVAIFLLLRARLNDNLEQKYLHLTA